VQKIVTMGSTAEALAAKIDALADALRAAGIDEARTTTILGSAAEATMHALMLDAVLDEQVAPVVAVQAVEVVRAESPVRLAA
jgi:hypothetical protein